MRPPLKMDGRRTVNFVFIGSVVCLWINAVSNAFPVVPGTHRRNGVSLAVATVPTPGNTPPSPSFKPKYPTSRGETVDSRDIVVTARRFLSAIRVHHILLITEDMANESLRRLRAAEIPFADLAGLVSACTATRVKGGALGWISVQEEHYDENHQIFNRNAHLDDIFPSTVRAQLLHMKTKPGDIVMLESTLGFHLIQIVDLMTDVRQMADHRPRKSTWNRGLLGGAIYNNSSTTLTYRMETMGCQMNAADSERIEGQLQNIGIQPLHGEGEPDVVVLNTCSIREHAEQKVYAYLGPYAKRKRNGEDVTIVVAGCVAQQEGQALMRRVPEIDLVMGPQYANRIADLLEDVANGNQVVATEATHIMEDSTKPRRQSTVAAWVNVIYGCNERCTFCIVPTTRGVEQSRPVESILEEVQDLVQQGYQEITLLGQNIDAYGRDMVPKRRFSDLIRLVGSVPGLKRFRFVTSHPRYMSMGVVDAVAETPAACEYFHIPFQSGSNKILEAMGRGHTRERYLYIVDRIRSVSSALHSICNHSVVCRVTPNYVLTLYHWSPRGYPMLL